MEEKERTKKVLKHIVTDAINMANSASNSSVRADKHSVRASGHATAGEIRRGTVTYTATGPAACFLLFASTVEVGALRFL